MADAATCDRCGADLLGAEVRYLAEMRVWAAYDPIEIGSREGLAGREFGAAYQRALEEAKRLSEEEAANSVYWSRRFDLCAECQKKLLAEPLGKQSLDGRNQ